MKKLYITLSVLFFLGISFFLYFREGTLPFNKTDKSSKIFVIPRGTPLQSIINSLSKEDLIRNKVVFFLIVKQRGIERNIQAGDFRLSPSMNAYEIADNLTHGTLDVWITLKEGIRSEEMAQVIGKELDIPEVEFIAQAREGYMFPDTYLIPKDATAGSVINILLGNYNRKFAAEMKESAANKGLSEEEVVTIASIVERETQKYPDKRIVAGIILKRLESDWPLQVDATIQYALGYQADAKSWWKQHLTFDDLKIKSPYNSYLNKGLPPTPISNPGLDSIRAVINADMSTPYWFYISDLKGNMHYGVTDEDHAANIRKYLR